MDEMEEGSKRTAQVPDEMTKLNDVITRLGKDVESVEMRLATVLVEPLQDKVEDGEEEVLVYLAGDIRKARAQLVEICRQLESKMRRVEL